METSGAREVLIFTVHGGQFLSNIFFAVQCQDIEAIEDVGTHNEGTFNVTSLVPDAV